MSWFVHTVPPKDQFFLSFRRNGKSLRNYFVVRVPSGEEVNAWVPDGCTTGSELLIQVADHPESRELLKQLQSTATGKENYKALKWQDLHMLCLQRGLKPFGHKRELIMRLKKLDQQSKTRRSLRETRSIKRLYNPNALEVIPVKLLLIREGPAYLRNPDVFRKMDYEDLLALCIKYEIVSRRAPHKELAKRLVMAKRAMDDQFTDLYHRFVTGAIKPIVPAPATGKPQRKTSSSLKILKRLSLGKSGGKTPTSEGDAELRSRASNRTTDTRTTVGELPMFDDMDVDGSGTISADELQTALTQDGEVQFQLKTCEMLIAMVDLDNNGEIDRYEFPGLLQYLTDWESSFASYDEDNSGTIDIAELKQALADNGYNFAAEFFGVLVASYDQGGKGALGLDEFIQLFCELTSLTRVYVNHTLGKTTNELAMFSEAELIHECSRYAPEGALRHAFAANEIKTKLGTARFDFESFLYHIVSA